jgi:hypothetical protein
MNDKGSLVIMNWLRPDVLKNMLEQLVEYETIDEVIISHGREDTYFEFDNAKVVNEKHWGNINEQFGLSRRFLSASQAKNEVILMIDDDEYPSEEYVKKLLKKYNENPRRLYGRFGRNLKKGNYNLHQRYGNVCVLITKCILFNKELCAEFFKHKDSVMHIIEKGKPLWNGEDVFMSAIACNFYGTNNYCVDGSGWINPIDGRENKRSRSVSSWKNHRWFRSELVHFCAKHFNIWDNYVK